MFDSLQPQGLQHPKLFCPLLSPRLCPNSCPLTWWCHPVISSSVALFSCPQAFPASGSFSNESALCIRWPKYWNFSFSINLSKEYSGLISFRMDWLDLLAVQGTLKSLLQQPLQSKRLSGVFFSTIIRKHQFFHAQTSLWSNSHNCTWPLEKP